MVRFDHKVLQYNSNRNYGALMVLTGTMVRFDHKVLQYISNLNYGAL